MVDFLLSLLTLPLGRADRLLRSADGSVGSIGNLHDSVERLENKFICHGKAKHALLTPAGICVSGKLLQLLEAVAPAVATQIFRCNSDPRSYPNCRNYVTMVSGTPCGNCFVNMTTPLELRGSVSAVAGGGFVQQIVTYTVMDDLNIMHMSTISLPHVQSLPALFVLRHFANLPLNSMFSGSFLLVPINPTQLAAN
jgi:hypothetical protein